MKVGKELIGRNNTIHLFSTFLKSIRDNAHKYTGYPLDSRKHSQLSIHDKINFKGCFPLARFYDFKKGNCNINYN